jgi:hypothetical protein
LGVGLNNYRNENARAPRTADEAYRSSSRAIEQ